MTTDPGRLRAAMASLLVVGGLLFGIGVIIEKGLARTPAPGAAAATEQPNATPTAIAASATPTGGEPTGGEAGHGSEAPHASANANATATASGEAGGGETGGETGHGSETGAPTGTDTHEAILGIDPEQPVLVILAIVTSLLAAFLVWRDGRRFIVAGAVLVALGFAGLDALEVANQLREGTVLIAAIATLVALAHIVAAGVGIVVVRRPVSG